MKRLLLVILCLLLAPLAPLAAPPEVMPAEEQLNLKVRQAIAAAVDYIRSQIDKNNSGLMIPPTDTRKIVAWKEIIIRYSEKKSTQKEPIWENEWVQEYRYATSDASHKTLVKVRRRRLVGYKDVNRVRQVRDKNGPIERQHRAPVYEEGGKPRWYAGSLGHNALALYALQKAGVPTDDPLMERLAVAMQVHIEAYGVPDSTYDVAWAAAAFCNWPGKGKRLDTLRRMLVSKLVDGQVARGDGKGMWGPVCQNPALIAEMVKAEMRIGAVMGEAKEKFDKRPTSTIYRKKYEEAKAKYDKFIDQFRYLTRRAQSLQGVRNPVTLEAPTSYEPPDGFSDIIGGIITPRLPFDYTRHFLVDLESTAFALMGLREAAANGYLPKTIDRPRAEKSPVMPPITTAAVLDKAAEAVANIYSTRKKGWTEGNHCRWITDFVFANPIRDATDHAPFKLQSEHWPTSDAQAYAALRSLGVLRGGKTMRSEYGGALKRAQELASANIVKVDDKKTRYAGLQHDKHDFYYFLTGFQRDYGSHFERRRKEWSRTAWRLAKTHHADGGWGASWYGVVSSSGTEYRIETELARRKITKEPDPYTGKRDSYKRNYSGEHSRRVPGRLIGTLHYMLFLIDAIRPPVALHWQWQDKASRLYSLDRAVGDLEGELKQSLSFARIEGKVTPGMLTATSALVINGEEAMPEEKKELLKAVSHYLATGGLLIVETKGSKAGKAFVDDVGAQLKEMFPGARLGPVAMTKVVEDPKKLKAAKVLSLVTAENKVVAIFFPLGSKNSGSVVTPERAGGIIARVLAERVPPHILAPDFPMASQDETVVDDPSIFTIPGAE